MNTQTARPTKEKTPPAPARPQAKTVATARALQIKQPTIQPPVSPSADLQTLIAKRAYELHAGRDYRHGNALDDWLDAERKILSQSPGK